MRAHALILAAIVLVAGAVGVLWIADLDESAGRETGVTLNDVAADPGRYDGRTVTISGEYAENDFFTLADAELALVIGDDADRRLLVLPQPQAAVPEGIDDNSVLRVTGVVRVVEPESPGAGDEGVLSQGGLLAQSAAEAVIEATDVSRAGDEPGPSQRTVSRVTVAQLIEDPRGFRDGLVRVSGRAYRIGSGGFVLAGDRRSIFVGAPASELSALEAGDRVVVEAELERISRFRATTIAEALAGTPETDASTPDGVDLDRTPAEQGGLFLVLRGLRKA